jgi:creatinine amidohydrolase
MVLEQKVSLERMTSKQVQEAVKESGGIVVIPVGAVENHGPGLPLNTDTLYTVEVVMRAAAEVGAVVAPVVPWGNTEQQMGFAGTIHIRNQTLIELIKDICRSLVRHGFDRIVVVNGHGGNIAPLDIACEEIHYETGAQVCNVAVWQLEAVPKPPGAAEIDGHGGSQETSTCLAISPQDVDLENLVRGDLLVEFPTGSAPMPRIISEDVPIHVMTASNEMSRYGIFGDPDFASVERGQKVLDAWTRVLTEFLGQLKRGDVGRKRA